MKRRLHIDFETRSEIDIKISGLYRYATHQSTRVLMLGWSVDDEDPRLWQPHLGQMPERLRTLLLDPDVEIVAFNTTFERYILQYVLGIVIPIERFQDPQASARYLSIPGHLSDAGEVLGLPHELRKDKNGTNLIKLFSMPQTRKKTELKKDPTLTATYFNDWSTHPQEWKEFGDYCLQDIRAEREVARRETLLGAFPLPPRERQIWILDQKINDRGMPIDMQFILNAYDIASRDKQAKLEKQNQITGLENANSGTQLLPWLQQRGYPLSNLRAQNVDLVLKNPDYTIDPVAREVLLAKKIASSTSYKKLETMVENACDDNTIKNMFLYMGSARCGRWSGATVQPHNFARPDKTFKKMKNVQDARNLVYALAFEELQKQFPKHTPLTVIKNLIRTVFVAPKGKRFNVCDLNAIETRVGAWVAGCDPLLKVFADGRDPYLDFAEKIYGIPYDKLKADYDGKNGEEAQVIADGMRQIAKPGVLGAVYRLGAGGWGRDKNGDVIKTGLWGYAEAMGVDMTQEQAVQVVKIFREAYKEIGGAPDSVTGFKGGIWYVLEEAVKDVLNGERTIRKVGPEGCIVIDKITIEGRNPMLRIKLPSGRFLHYMDAAIESVKMPWRQKRDVAVSWNDHGEETAWETQEVDVHKPGFTYYGMDQNTKQWTMIVSHGGKIFENIVQAIARDVLADKLLEFENNGLPVVGHVHDEGICLTDDDPFAPGVLQMEQIMNRPVDWAKTLPLGSDGFEDLFYHK